MSSTNDLISYALSVPALQATDLEPALAPAHPGAPSAALAQARRLCGPLSAPALALPSASLGALAARDAGAGAGREADGASILNFHNGLKQRRRSEQPETSEGPCEGLFYPGAKPQHV